MKLTATGWTTVTIACLLMSFAAGCGRTVDRVERAEPVGSPNIVDEHRVLHAGGLNRYVSVVNVRETTVSGDMLKIEVELECRTNSAQRFLYAFEWFDHQGMQLNNPQWRRMTLQGRQRGVISEVAATADAVDFRLHLRRGSP